MGDDTKNKKQLTRKCVIPECTTYATLGIPVHRFPKEEPLLSKWLEALNNVKIHCISIHTIICGLHFKKLDYLNPEAKSRRLKSNAVPSLHLSHHHILDGEELSSESSEEEPDIVVEESLKEAADTDVSNDITSDLEKLMGMDISLERSVVDPIVAELNNELSTNKEVQTETEKCIDSEVQTDNENSVDKEVQTDNKNSVDKEVQTGPYSFLDFFKKDADLLAFTGVKFSVLKALVESVKLVQNISNDKRLCSIEERIVLTLCKLRLNLSFHCLGVLFKISTSTASNYFAECVHLLACILEEAVYFADKEEIQHNLPTCFNQFQDTRIILDCTEIAVQNSKCLQCRLKMYSHYKGRQTLKVLIGITPSGLISYCSKCYGGRASDKSIFLQSELLKRLIPNEDAIMVDKGFMIKSECDEVNIKLIRPPFADKSNQMSAKDSLKTKKIAEARVHVERSIQRMKTFAILKSTIDWDMTKYFDKIMIIICGLVNLGSPIIDKTRFSN